MSDGSPVFLNPGDQPKHHSAKTRHGHRIKVCPPPTPHPQLNHSSCLSQTLITTFLPSFFLPCVKHRAAFDWAVSMISAPPQQRRLAEGPGRRGTRAPPLRARRCEAWRRGSDPPCHITRRRRPINSHNGRISAARVVSLTSTLSLCIGSLEACLTKGRLFRFGRCHLIFVARLAAGRMSLRVAGGEKWEKE